MLVRFLPLTNIEPFLSKREASGKFELEAGSENRTRINSLEGYGFTTKLCPHISTKLANACLAFITLTH